jgi:hypothetical protein
MGISPHRNIFIELYIGYFLLGVRDFVCEDAAVTKSKGVLLSLVCRGTFFIGLVFSARVVTSLLRASRSNKEVVTVHV